MMYLSDRKVSTHIVEFHNEALTHIYRGIGSKVVPYNDLTLVHFDSHPDLGIPPDLEADKVYQKEVLFESLQIESWILPAVYAGHISSIIWLKPNWSSQIPEGKYQFAIGKDIRDAKIRVTSCLPYFVSDCMFVEEENLENKKQLQLTVINVGQNNNSKISLNEIIGPDQSYILDIDLDFFSTCNPFRDMFSHQDLSDLTDLYWFEVPFEKDVSCILSCQRKRQEQLDKLKAWMVLVQNGQSIDEEKFFTLNRIVKNYEADSKRKLDDEDIEIIHGAGCATDEPSLPHHISTEIEINDLLKAVTDVLKSINYPPNMITIARSTEDGYCPSSQVDSIQSKTVGILQELYRGIDVFNHYCSD